MYRFIVVVFQLHQCIFIQRFGSTIAIAAIMMWDLRVSEHYFHFI